MHTGTFSSKILICFHRTASHHLLVDVSNCALIPLHCYLIFLALVQPPPAVRRRVPTNSHFPLDTPHNGVRKMTPYGH